MSGPASGARGARAVRPAVSVVVPFAGSSEQAAAVIARFAALARGPQDQLIIADNSGTVTGPLPDGVQVVRAQREASAAHARNVGAAASAAQVRNASAAPPAAQAHKAGAAAPAASDWILFLDADVYPPADLIDQFFAQEIPEQVGAVTGDIHGIPDTSTLAARYGTARNFLGQRSHVMNPYRPRASSANLLVRRAAFDAIGGYTEGIWAAEDTDFTWRLQEAGWKLAFNEHAVVRHEYRKSLRALGKQWRGYAAGAAWLARRYPDFKPDPGLNRLARIALKKVGIGPGVAFRADGRAAPWSANLSRWQRAQFFAINCYLGVQEQIGLRMSNAVAERPQR